MDIAAAVATNAKLLGLAGLPLNTQRRTVALLRAWQAEHDLEPDGVYDAATEESLNTALHALEDGPGLVAEPDDQVIVQPGPYRAGVKPLGPWPGPTPMTSAQWKAAAGTPGPPGSAWEKANIVDAKNLDERHGSTGVFRLALPYAKEGIARVRATGYPVERCGGYVYRHIRHDPTMPLSKHASGLALDLNSNANFSKTFDVNEDGPEPFTPAWCAIWNHPHAITQQAVEAMESCGWKWGGRWRAPKGKRGFRDPMHFQR